ncbi:1-propanol dehydrogenase PduQ [Oleisolibacter albus]|uniref:1-propanol dehydrogenase PduQ n=1 Tax=Oleisolibacter albus TaxID=2171757 RepID=UPI000DF3BE07|nr:1-propanol dehydrogenase PduQ [Oleisolibacter albus]
MTGFQRFFLKTEIVSGPGMYGRFGAFAGKRVGIITDAFMVKSGVVDRIRAKLPPCEVEVFSQVVPEPPLQDVVKGAGRMAEFRPDVLLAIGGGSAIDAAKAILATLREAAATVWPIQLAAVPTTSGTGSEVTCYAVISEPERGLKHPLRGDGLVPDIAVLDPELVLSVPAKVTADTGMDVITHALEAYVAVGASDFSDAFAEKAVSLAFANLTRVFDDGSDLAARTALHNASCMAGMAFNAAGLGLNHGLAHAIGGQLHIPHGRINAMLLPLVVAYNAGLSADFGSCLPAAGRYAAIAARLGLEASTPRAGAASLAKALSRLNERLGIPVTLRAAGIDPASCTSIEQDLVNAALADACTASNPRRPTADEVRQLIRAVAG